MLINSSLIQYAEEGGVVYLPQTAADSAIIKSSAPDTNISTSTNDSILSDVVRDDLRPIMSGLSRIGSANDRSATLHKFPSVWDLSQNQPMSFFVPAPDNTTGFDVQLRMLNGLRPSVLTFMTFTAGIRLSAIVSTWSVNAVTWNTRPPVQSLQTSYVYVSCVGVTWGGYSGSGFSNEVRYKGHEQTIRFEMTSWGNINPASIYGLQVDMPLFSCTSKWDRNVVNYWNARFPVYMNRGNSYWERTPQPRLIPSVGSAEL